MFPSGKDEICRLVDLTNPVSGWDWVAALILASWLVCAPGRESSARPVCPSGRLCVQTCSTAAHVTHIQTRPCGCLLFLLVRPSTHSLSLVSVSQGSTESCNNTEEEELKGRKGTGPVFSSSACKSLCFSTYLVKPNQIDFLSIRGQNKLGLHERK